MGEGNLGSVFLSGADGDGDDDDEDGDVDDDVLDDEDVAGSASEISFSSKVKNLWKSP